MKQEYITIKLDTIELLKYYKNKMYLEVKEEKKTLIGYIRYLIYHNSYMICTYKFNEKHPILYKIIWNIYLLFETHKKG
jgi:DNA-directed RNA polymerase subunit L